MRRTVRCWSFLLPLALGTSACAGDDPPALSAAGVAFSESELLGLNAGRRQLLGELTAFAVAASDSALEALGHPLVQARERDRLWRLLQAERALDSAGVDDGMLEARYQTDPRWERTVRHLLVLSPRYETDETRARAREKARQALERIGSGEDFPAVAAELSEEPGAEGRQGLLTPGREGSWVPEFWRAALALEPGEVSDVVETQYGFHVLRLEDRQVVPFAEARTEVLLDVARMLVPLDEAAEAAPLPPGFRLAGEVPASGLPAGQADATPVAHWEGGSLTRDTLALVLAALPLSRWQATRADPAALEHEVEAAARAVHAARTATSAGLSAGDAWRTAERRAWSDRAWEWARMLGFRPGLSADGLKQAAREALGATGQNATVARNQVQDAAPLLHHAYTLETAPPDGA